MKAKEIALTLVVAMGAAKVLAIEFSGYFATPAGVQFLLKDPSSGAVSEWLRIGQEFNAHRIVAFDEAREIIVLERKGERVEVRLINSRTVRSGGKYPYDHPDKRPENRVTIVGAVAEEGSLLPNATTTVDAAIAAMGGFKSGAKIREVSLTRSENRERNGELRKAVSIRLLDLSSAEGRAFKLLPGDVLHVPGASSER